jgi:uncharacterized delta-60 repeat protein
VIRNANTQEARFVTHLGVILSAALLLILVTGCGDETPGATPTPAAPIVAATPTVQTAAITPPNTGGPASSGAGTLDTTFGDDGRVVTDLNGRSDEAFAVVVQPDGKIVVAGETWVYPQERPRFALARYNPDGTLDPSFGEAGQVMTGMTDDEWDYSVPRALALQPDGKLLVAGTSYDGEAGHNVFALARFNTEGTLDAAFGRGGRVLTPIDSAEDAGNDEAFALALAADGTIVLAGVTGSFPTNFAAARYLPDGNLDPSFGNGGTVVTDLGGEDKAAAVGIQPDGKVVLAGRGATNDDDWAMLRYLPNGDLDPAFGDGGKVVTDFNGGEDWVGGLVIRSDGAIVVGGQVHVGVVFCTDQNGFTRGCDKFGSALVQYKPDGTLDTGFGDGGKALYDFDLTSGTAALALQPDGKIVLAGHYDYDDFAVVRANADGALDSRFGDGGLTRTPFGRSLDAAYAVALQKDGAIVAAGAGTLNEDDPLNDNFALARYHGK